MCYALIEMSLMYAPDHGRSVGREVVGFGVTGKAHQTVYTAIDMLSVLRGGYSRGFYTLSSKGEE